MTALQEVPRKRATPLPRRQRTQPNDVTGGSSLRTVGDAAGRPARPACTNHVDLFDRAADASVKPGYTPPV